MVKIVNACFYLISDSCRIENGECKDICVPEENGRRRRCECDIGLQLQSDQSCNSGQH